MRQFIIILGIIISSQFVLAQSNLQEVLSAVEKNNKTLIALRQSTDAEKLENKTGIYLENPEVGFNYLWGNPTAIGNRTDISISQSFDFPTVYKNKNQIANIRNEQAELEYIKQLKATHLETHNLCFDIVYVNSLQAELNKRLVHAESIAKSYKAKFELGEINILEYNKSQLNLLNLSKEIKSIKIEKASLLAELTGLNGGLAVDINNLELLMPAIPVDFEEWYLLAEANNPILNWLKQEISLSQTQVKLNKAQSMPKFQAGYMSESIVGEKFQGVSFGMSIPLWENKNTVKYAKANALALESITVDNKLKFYNQLKSLHTKAISLQKNTEDYRTNIQSYDNSVLLEKALDNGEISLIEYMLEFAIYYESVNNLLELERDMNKTVAELNQFM